MPRKTIADLELELARKDSELKSFKENVVKAAREKAEEHGWCNVVNQTLSELGLIEFESETWEVVVTFTVEGTARGGYGPDLSITSFSDDGIEFDDNFIFAPGEDGSNWSATSRKIS